MIGNPNNPTREQFAQAQRDADRRDLAWKQSPSYGAMLDRAAAYRREAAAREDRNNGR